jgi:cardiolipin synthase
MARSTWRSILKIFPTIILVVDIIIRIGAVVTVPRNRRPSSAMAWLLAIFISPIPGSLLYILLGSSRLPKDRRDKQREVNAFILDAAGPIGGADPTMAEPAWFGSVVHPHYEASIQAMTDAVASAQLYVHVEFYILGRDDTTAGFFDALKSAHERGVTVRVLYDHWATMRNPRGRSTRAWLRQSGIPFEEMLPFRPWQGNWRRPDLRKIVVVDGHVAFTGSQNMIDASYDKRGNIRRGLKWKDLMVRLEGPAALGLDALFVTDWYSETGDIVETDDTRAIASTSPDSIECQVVPSGPGFEGENNLRLFNALVYGAQERLIIASPYFVPDDSMLYAITTAAERGVDVQLFACAVADQYVVYHAQRSYYETLLRSGVRIFLYDKPTVLHSKHFTVDDDVAVVGSSNMDMRSFSLNFEVSLMVRSARFVDELREIEDSYREKSREITLEQWLARPAIAQALDTVARLTAAVQ